VFEDVRIDAPVLEESPVFDLKVAISQLQQATPEERLLQYMISKLIQAEAHHKEKLEKLEKIENASKQAAEKLWYLEQYLEAQEMDDHTLERKQKCEDELFQENFKDANIKRSQLKYIGHKECLAEPSLETDWLASHQVFSSRMELRDQMTRENSSGAMLGHYSHRVMAGERRSEPSLHPQDYARVVAKKQELQLLWTQQETTKKALQTHLKDLEARYLTSILAVVCTYVHAYACMHMHACICMHAYACMHMHACTCMPAYACMHMHACICMYVRTTARIEARLRVSRSLRCTWSAFFELSCSFHCFSMSSFFLTLRA